MRYKGICMVLVASFLMFTAVCMMSDHSSAETEWASVDSLDYVCGAIVLDGDELNIATVIDCDPNCGPTVTIPDHITVDGKDHQVVMIGPNAFDDCIGLERIVFETGQFLGYSENVFSGIPSDIVLDLGSSPVPINLALMNDFAKVRSIEVSEDNPMYVSVDGVLYDKGFRTVIFVSKDLTDVKVLDSVEAICDHAFDGCDRLLSITLGKGLKNIPAGTFDDCSSVNAIRYDCTSLENKDGVAYLSSIGSASKDVSFIVGDGVEHIPSYILHGSPYLKSITLGKDVGSIGHHAFSEAVNVETVRIDSSDHNRFISDSFEKMGSKGTGIDLIFGGNLEYVFTTSFLDRSLIRSIYVEDGVRFIDSYAFSWCINVKFLYLPDSLEIIWPEAFEGMNSIETLYYNVNDDVNSSSFRITEGKGTDVIIGGNSTSIDSQLFEGSTALRSVSIYAPVGCIDAYTFRGCTMLEHVSLPDSVRYIGYEAFYMCRNLKSIDFGDSLVDITERAFYNCSSLVEVDLSMSAHIRVIEGAFHGCTSLETVKLPSESELLPDSFSDCVSLRNVLFKVGATFEAPEDGVIIDGKGRLLYYSPYKTDSVYVVPDEIRSVEWISPVTNPYLRSLDLNGTYCDEDLSGFSALEYIHYGVNQRMGHFNDDTSFPIGLKGHIVADANPELSEKDGVLFNRDMTELVHYPANKGLRGYTVPDTVEVIRKGAFEHAIGLETIDVPSSVKSMDNAFLDCMSLKRIVVEGSNAVYRSIDGVLYDRSMYKLVKYPSGKVDASFTLPNSVRVIGIGAFDITSHLESLTIPSRMSLKNGLTDEASDSISVFRDSEHVSAVSISSFIDGTVYIEWDPGAASIVFVYPDHEEVRSFEPGTMFGDLPEFDVDGYVGWYSGVNGGLNITYDMVVPGSGLEKVYLMPKAKVYTVTFDDCNGDVQIMEIVEREVYGSLPTPVMEGHEFVGWFTEKDGGEQVRDDMVVYDAEGQVLYAHWTPSVYSVTFSLGGGGDITMMMEYGSTIPLPDSIPARDPTEHLEYEFVEWNGYTEGMTVIGHMYFYPDFRSVPKAPVPEEDVPDASDDVTVEESPTLDESIVPGVTKEGIVEEGTTSEESTVPDVSDDVTVGEDPASDVPNDDIVEEGTVSEESTVPDVSDDTTVEGDPTSDVTNDDATEGENSFDTVIVPDVPNEDVIEKDIILDTTLPEDDVGYEWIDTPSDWSDDSDTYPLEDEWSYAMDGDILECMSPEYLESLRSDMLAFGVSEEDTNYVVSVYQKMIDLCAILIEMSESGREDEAEMIARGLDNDLMRVEESDPPLSGDSDWAEVQEMERIIDKWYQVANSSEGSESDSDGISPMLIVGIVAVLLAIIACVVAFVLHRRKQEFYY